MSEYAEYKSCRLCPRRCGVDRTHGGRGVCSSGDTPLVAHVMLHEWEEPFLVGDKGSGAVFFSGCGLGCVYCQNRVISCGGVGSPYSKEALAALYLSLEHEGAANINLVTASHFLPHIRASLILAKEDGLSIPVVYNTSGYESVESLQALDGLVDVYLTDFRYASPQTARRYSRAPHYPDVAGLALREMVRQTGEPLLDGRRLIRGTVIRLLLLPGHLVEAKLILRRLYAAFGDGVYFSLMSQYTPVGELTEYPELDRTVSSAEYHSLVEYACSLGVTNAYVQEGSAAKESFIPDFLSDDLI